MMNDIKPNRDETAQASEAQPGAEQATERTEAERQAVGEQLQAENARLKEELRREHEIYMRNLADFDNYRRRVERERAGAAQAGRREMVLSLLDVLDDFERALEHMDEAPASVSAGLSAIYRRLAGLLESQGVIPFESVGQPFDPALHEALGSVESDEQEPGVVLDEVSRGYRWGEELLRPARVRVAR
jgi:molecular chaperone GrpE